MILAASSYAATITMTHTGVGSGQIGSTSFTNAAFTITDIADTTNRQLIGTAYFINDNSASIAITGLGTFNFTTATRTYVSNGGQIVGFSRSGSAGADLFSGPQSTLFTTWDMLSSIGPVSGTGSLFQWALSQVNTNAGVLTFNDGSSNTVFTAGIGGTTVPEPSSLISIGTSLIGLAGLAWRRRKSVG